MADIEYRIDYDAEGLITSQHILQLGTEDRVRFVTTPHTIQYLSEKNWRLALQRNPGSKTPFKNGLADPYIVPVNSAPPHWIKVQGEGNGFHWDCGYVDEHGTFQKWPEPLRRPARLAVAHSQPQQVNSLPFPT
jgi:hypothetical protein